MLKRGEARRLTAITRKINSGNWIEFNWLLTKHADLVISELTQKIAALTIITV